MFKKFPKAGERVTASIAPFQLKQNGLSYSWDGVVTRAGAEKPNKPAREARSAPTGCFNLTRSAA
jgi:hypothetical protein